MLIEGCKYYTIDLENLSEENVRNNEELIVRMAFWFNDECDNNLKTLGVCFETKEEAIEKAKQIYYKLKWESLTTPAIDSADITATFDIKSGKVVCVHSRSIGDRCTKTEEEMSNVLKEIGEINFVKYVLGLSNVTVYVPVEI